MRYRIGWLLIWLSLSCAALAQPPRLLRLVHCTDIHAGGPYYRPEAWWQALSEGYSLGPDVVVLTGDQGDNSRNRQAFIERLRAFLNLAAEPLREGRVPVVLTLGNDDVQENYQSDPESLRQTTATYRQTLGPLYYLDELGNGRHPTRIGGMTWLSLNTNVFSVVNHYRGAPAQAERSLRWLRQELSQCGNSPVVLVLHIPPTLDMYRNRPSWRTDCQQRFQAILAEYPGPVLILAGHYHFNLVQAIKRTRGDVPVLVAGSLSGKFGYLPNWRNYVWHLNERGAVAQVDYTVRYPGHPEWNAHYSLRPGSLEAFRQSLASETGYLRYLQDFYCRSHNWRTFALRAGRRQEILDGFWVRKTGS